MIYVYAITDRPDAPLPPQSGLRDADLAKIVWRDVAAVVSPFGGASLSNTGDELWRHEEVVEALMLDRVALPARFGTLLPSRNHVGDMVRQAYDILVQDIERVRGHVEIGMRFLSTIENGAEADRSLSVASEFVRPETGPGAAYLSARLARKRELGDRQRARLGLVRGPYERLASQASASKLEDEPGDRHGTSAAFLVRRDDMASFQGVISDVAKAHPELALLCTGPWPPYSFVSAAAGAANWSDERYAS